MKHKLYQLLHLPKRFIMLFRLSNIKQLLKTGFSLFAFIVLLFGYIIGSLLSKLRSFMPDKVAKFVSPPFARLYKLLLMLNNKDEKTISRISLIELAIKNMFAKKSRTIITIGGMSIGIGAIVFLVSLGYGVQQLVISRVARLDELKQINVIPQTGSKNRINDKSVNDFKGIENVTEVLPLIAVVGKIKFQNSVSDVATFGVTSEYLNKSAIKPIRGEIYASDEVASIVPGNPLLGGEESGEVAGVSTDVLGVSTGTEIKQGEKIGEAEYSINPKEWLRVRDAASSTGKILGYTRRVEGQQIGVEYWGSSYPDSPAGKSGEDSNKKVLGKWIKSKVHLWKQESCTSTVETCEDGKYIKLKDESGNQIMEEGYFAEINVSVRSSYDTSDAADVLGISTSSDVLAESSESAELTDDGYIEIASLSAQIKNEEITKLPLGQQAKKVAVVNTQLLDLLGLTADNAIGKTFTVSFVVTGDLLTKSESKVESNDEDYTIVAVIPADKSPVMYVPFIDLRSLGIVNFSQVKVVTRDSEDISIVRKQIAAMGFSTNSVADTVVQINSLFATVRLLLAALGLVALSVASLGMFNTLTVSLMERTREVGLMKAMGMRSREIHELFLTESMIMGIFGGLLGLAWGFGLGKLLSSVLSVFTLTKGIGFIDVTYIPLAFTLIIIFLSLIVGVLTGIYPARRATKISALDALRYE